MFMNSMARMAVKPSTSAAKVNLPMKRMSGRRESSSMVAASEARHAPSAYSSQFGLFSTGPVSDHLAWRSRVNMPQ